MKPMQLIFASSNKNKLKEISALLPESITLSGLEDIGITQEIPETGATIKENSFLKAKYVIDFLKQPNASVFADDSGLEVEALSGAPGYIAHVMPAFQKMMKRTIKNYCTNLKPK